MPYFAIAKDRSGVYVMNDDNTPLMFYTPQTRNGQAPWGQFTDILDSYLAGDDSKADQVNLTLGQANKWFAEQQGQGQGAAPQGTPGAPENATLMPQGAAYAALLRPQTMALQWAVAARKNEAERLNHLADLRELEMKFPDLARSVYVVGEGSPDGNSGKVSVQNRITGEMGGVYERGQAPQHLFEGPGGDAITERFNQTAAAYDESMARQRHDKEKAQRASAPPPLSTFKEGGRVPRMAGGGSFGPPQQQPRPPAAAPTATGPLPPTPSVSAPQQQSAPTNPAGPPPVAFSAATSGGGMMGGANAVAHQLQGGGIEDQQNLQALNMQNQQMQEQFKAQQQSIQQEVQQKMAAIAAERDMAQQQLNLELQQKLSAIGAQRESVLQQLQAERQRFGGLMAATKQQKIAQLVQQGESLAASFRNSGHLYAKNPFASLMQQRAA